MKLSTLFAYATVAIAGTEAWSFTVWTEKDQKGKQRHYHSSLGDNDCYNFDDSITSKGRWVIRILQLCLDPLLRLNPQRHRLSGQEAGVRHSRRQGLLVADKVGQKQQQGRAENEELQDSGLQAYSCHWRVRDIVWTRPSASSPLTSPGAVMVPGNGTNWPLSMDVRAPRLHCPQRSSSIGCNGEPAVGHLTSWFQVTRHGYTRVATTALASSETFFATVAQNASPKGSGTRRLSKLRAERREVRKTSCAKT
ncbi:hypothetical protein ACCO45_004563 [Purpureocillium lilacinum]|uniref:Uncharacterized protein n=1 Tax=Purpureocillium lilacinum TaxID=33203 RepID=A0ACC4DSV1_PURLI